MRNLKLTLAMLGVCCVVLLVSLLTSDRPPAKASSKPNGKTNHPAARPDGAGPSDEPEQVGYVDPLWKLYKKYESAQRDFLAGVLVLTSNQRKEFEKVAEIRNRVEILELNMQTLRFQYLLDRRPEQIVRDHGLRRFVKVDWSESDQVDLEVDKPQTGQLKANIKALKVQLYGLDEWDAYRTFLQDELPQTAAFKNLAAKRDAIAREVANELGADKSAEIAATITPSSPIAELLPAHQGRFSGLGVRSSTGRVYFTMAGEMMEIRYLEPHEVAAYQQAGGSQDPGHIFWTRPKGSDRVELAGIKEQDSGAELIIVYNDAVPYVSAENAWARSRAFYSIEVSNSDVPPKLTTIASDVISLVIQKCK